MGANVEVSQRPCCMIGKLLTRHHSEQRAIAESGVELYFSKGDSYVNVLTQIIKGL